MTWDFLKGFRAGVMVHFFLASIGFTLSAFTGHFVMSVEVYGADVVEVPAEAWSLMMLTCSAAYLTALLVNGRHWVTPWVRFAAGSLLVGYFAKFVASAKIAPAGDLVMIFSLSFAVLVVVCGMIDGRELARKWRRNRVHPIA